MRLPSFQTCGGEEDSVRSCGERDVETGCGERAVERAVGRGLWRERAVKRAGWKRAGCVERAVKRGL